MNAVARYDTFPEFEGLDELKQAIEEGRRDGTLLEGKVDALLEVSLDVCGRVILNLETPHPIRLQYLAELRTLRKELKAARQQSLPVGPMGSTFAVQIVMPPGAAPPGASASPVMHLAGRSPTDTPAAPLIDIPFDDLGLPPAPDHIRAAAQRLNPEVIQ